MRIRFVVYFLLIAIFLFWFLLAKENFFHWDEWQMFILAEKSWDSLFLTSYAGHYIPLNLLYYFAMIRVFGLDYVPYQLVVSGLHVFNSLLLYLVVLRETKKGWLAVLALAVFGFSNVGVENLIWSLGMNYVAASLFVSLALLFFLDFENRQKPIFLFFSAIFLFLSPLFHNITILMPTVFLIILLTSKEMKEKWWAGVFLFIQTVLILLSMHFSSGEILGRQMLTIDRLFQMAVFVTVGLVRGNIVRFILPGFHFEQGADFVSKTLLIASAVGSLVLIGAAAVKATYANQRSIAKFLKIFRYLFFMAFIYLAAAPARSGINIGQAGISRYAYPSFFFGIIFVSMVLNELTRSQKAKLLTIVCAGLFLILNIKENIDFNRNFWSKLVNRDRKFISETQAIFKNNSQIADVNPKGIWPTMKLSQMWFLFPPEKKLIFVAPTKANLDEQYHSLLTEFQMKGD